MRSGIAPFHAMGMLSEANRLAAEGADVLHLEVGEPGASTPQAVGHAARMVLEQGLTGYTEALGYRPLRDAIAVHYKDFYGLDVGANQVVVTAGASAGFVLSFLALFDAGDRVALATPCYPAYRNTLEALGVEVVLVPGCEDSGYQLTAKHLAACTERLDGIVVASPANPTGSILSPSALEDLATVARDRELRVISDEIYHGIVYSASHPSILHYDPDAVVVNSFSKYFAMTGWRLGWLVVPRALVEPLERLAMSLYICPSAIAQRAACEVFHCYDELDAHVERYRKNRDFLVNELPKAGFRRMAPADGAFYLYADVSNLTSDSMKFALTMLRETGIAATPGIDFDPGRGHRYLRFSYSGETETIRNAVNRLKTWNRLRSTKGESGIT